MSILVTGATGFVGSAVVRRLASDADVHVRASVRTESSAFPAGVEACRVGALASNTDWGGALRGTTAVVHAAARAHIMHDTAADPLAEFRHVNVAGTAALARQAARAGVRRFVFISSIKVNGEETRPGHPYTPDDEPAPADPYGISKREAEDDLRLVARETGMEVAIIRPVLVYGPGVKGNFLSMVRWLQRGVPLPLGMIHNRRSLVALENLVDLIAVALTHPGAINQTLLVSDGEDLSTTELLRRTGAALGKRARLLPVPASLVRAAARALGKPGLASRLCGSLQVDMSRTRALLGWTPPVRVDDALRATVRHLAARDGR